MPTPTFVDLSISLEREAHSDGYRVRVRSRLSTSAAEEDAGARSLAPVRFDYENLRATQLDPQAYGQLLTATLFADDQIRRGFSAALAQARGHNAPLRLRLALDPEDAALHGVRWEWLQDPDTGAFLALNERVLLSRYLLGGNGEPVKLPDVQHLRALVVIASPTDLHRFDMAQLDLGAEEQRIMTALAPIQATLLARETDNPPTMANVLAALRDGYELLIIVAHGSFQDGTPILWLEKSDATSDRVKGSDLRCELEGATRRPQLAILAACEGAGRDHGDEALAALGPLLVAAGVSAVVAMQGRVSIAAVHALLPTLISELRREPQIDLALAAARRAAQREHADWWRPTLTMRVRDGRVWNGAAPLRPQRAGGTPFIAGPPVPPDQLRGRHEQIRAIKDRIGGVVPQSLSIVGYRRSGKSSLLNYIHQRIGEFCTHAQSPLVVRISLQDSRFQTPAGITEGLRRGIEQQTGTAPWRREEHDDPWAVDDGLQHLRDRGRRLIVLIDEFEQLEDRLPAFEGWGGDWREKASQGYFALVIATVHPIDTIYHDLGLTSPFGNIFTTTELGALSSGEWQALVRDGFGAEHVSNADIELIDDLAGGLPFYTQLAAQLLWSHNDHARTRAEYTREVGPHFSNLWDKLNAAERHALRHAAGIPGHAAPHPGVRSKLQRHGILRADGRLFSSVLDAWVRDV
ncbi:CHAT domain-containing protein [Candidatus Oscillochloris fontis]|uniref:CHAT domain-containing protein n=1 Tax=Candidatus Oscillochloris fontis TaxID=2496868 RepID=UPI00101CBC17|nr:CHAT domain-containing protein [Candidatus Oscillochloris fontis]